MMIMIENILAYVTLFFIGLNIIHGLLFIFFGKKHKRLYPPWWMLLIYGLSMIFWAIVGISSTYHNGIDRTVLAISILLLITGPSYLYLSFRDRKELKTRRSD